MIDASLDTRSGLAARLVRKARRLALAHAQNRRRALLRDPARWRRADLVWPLFTPDI